MIRPTYLQRAISYIRNGDPPPLPHLVREAGSTLTISATLCLGIGLIIGRFL